MVWPSPGEHGIPDLSGLQASWLRFHLRTTTPLKFPIYKGSTFHGAFGWALRQLYRPLYDLLFESPPLPSSFPRCEEHTSVLPKPFVLVPPLGTQCDYPAGSDLSCNLLFKGLVCAWPPFCYKRPSRVTVFAGCSRGHRQVQL